jgi:hypothetical protein
MEKVYLSVSHFSIEPACFYQSVVHKSFALFQHSFFRQNSNNADVRNLLGPPFTGIDCLEYLAPMRRPPDYFRGVRNVLLGV